MKKLKNTNTLSLILSNALFATCAYYGVYKGMTGFMNVLSFITWFCFVVSLLTVYSDEEAIIHYKRVSSRINFGIFEKFYDAAFVCVLVYFGQFLLGSLYAVTVCFDIYKQERGKELVESADF